MLRELNGLAWERELSDALTELFGSFERWKAGEIDCWELNGLIHAHHQGPSRDLYVRYTSGEPELTVSYAVARGILNQSDLPETQRDQVLQRAEQLKEIWAATEEPKAD